MSHDFVSLNNLVLSATNDINKNNNNNNGSRGNSQQFNFHPSTSIEAAGVSAGDHESPTISPNDSPHQAPLQLPNNNNNTNKRDNNFFGGGGNNNNNNRFGNAPSHNNNNNNNRFGNNNNNNSGSIPSQLPGVPNILSLLQPASPLTTSQNAQNLHNQQNLSGQLYGGGSRDNSQNLSGQLRNNNNNNSGSIDNRRPSNIIVAGLLQEMNEEDLRSLFSRFGTILSAVVKIDLITGKSRGFGFVRFGSADEAEKAVIEMNRARLGPNVLNVELSKHDGHIPEHNAIFVRMWPEVINEEVTEQFFARFGAVQQIRRSVDRESDETLERRGYRANNVTVTYGRVSEARAAVAALHGTFIELDRIQGTIREVRAPPGSASPPVGFGETVFPLLVKFAESVSTRRGRQQAQNSSTGGGGSNPNSANNSSQLQQQSMSNGPQSSITTTSPQSLPPPPPGPPPSASNNNSQQLQQTTIHQLAANQNAILQQQQQQPLGIPIIQQGPNGSQQVVYTLPQGSNFSFNQQQQPNNLFPTMPGSGGGGIIFNNNNNNNNNNINNIFPTNITPQSFTPHIIQGPNGIQYLALPPSTPSTSSGNNNNNNQNQILPQLQQQQQQLNQQFIHLATAANLK